MDGDHLKAWRRALRLNRLRAAAALAVPVATYVNWEQDRYPMPPVAVRLCLYIRRFGALEP
jgi:DNA-binding transcriptional regulator YiaG